MDYLFKNEIETLIKLARKAADIIDPVDIKEAALPGEIETVCKRIEGYLEPSLRNPSDIKLTEDE